MHVTLPKLRRHCSSVGSLLGDPFSKQMIGEFPSECNELVLGPPALCNVRPAGDLLQHAGSL